MKRSARVLSLATVVAVAPLSLPANLTHPTWARYAADRATSAAAAGGAASAQPLATGYAAAPTTAAGPPTTTYCRNHYPYYPCYSPVQLRKAYRVGSLWKAGVRGRGSVIGIVDSFGSPTIKHDLHVFDQAYGLPDPPQLRIVRPAGAVPAFDKSNAAMRGWAFETTLDVEYAHAIAPKATIILAETPVNETEGVHGFPEIMKSERWLVNHTHVGVISQSFAATEETFPDAAAIKNLRYAFKAAQTHHVTVLAGSGDWGATSYRKDMQSFYGRRVVCWPASDPLVTAIGGTQLHLRSDGSRARPDTVWQDSSVGSGATGGGRSHVFGRPTYQSGVAATTSTHRGIPDISMNAAVTSHVLVYTSFPGDPAGWKFGAGTSEATPVFAGIIALTIQQAGRRLGTINPALYSLAGAPSSGVLDVVGGDNSYAGVTGWNVTTGYDLATGWGTIDASTFVPALAKAVTAG
jgi:subtilase family serine protease